MTKATACTGKHYPVADVRITILDCPIHGNTLLEALYEQPEGIETKDKVWRLTAQRMGAASALSIPSGIGVT
jgi:hypothetical protein